MDFMAKSYFLNMNMWESNRPNIFEEKKIF